MSLPAISKEHLPVCKMGQGEECCRYLVMAPGFSCAKKTSLAGTIDTRVFLEQMTARGDNCEGLNEVE